MPSRPRPHPVGHECRRPLSQKICYICGEDFSECPHTPGTEYIVEGGLGPLEWCRVCGAREQCEHVPSERYRAQLIVIVVDMQVEEVSLVDNPAYPDARITSIPYALEDLRKALGADFEPGVDVAPQGITINDVADVAHLRTIWKKEVRKVLRTLTFRDGNLAPDPIAYVGYEWGLEVFIQHLSRDLTAGAYVAEKAEIVRAAKTVGLSRPLAYLTVRDALVYRAITWLVRDDLTKGAREYVAFLRSSRAAQTI